MLDSLVLAVEAILIGVLYFFLVGISRFYRQKSGGGPSPMVFSLGIAILLAAAVTAAFAGSRWALWAAAALSMAASIGVIGLTLLLYRSMMSVNRGSR